MMKTQRQNIFMRILFIALLPLAIFACGDEADYMLEAGMSVETDETLVSRKGNSFTTHGSFNAGGTSSGQFCCVQNTGTPEYPIYSCACTSGSNSAALNCVGRDENGAVLKECRATSLSDCNDRKNDCLLACEL